MDQRVYWIWLQQALAPGSLLTGRLLEAFGSAAAVFAADDAALKEAGVRQIERRRLADKSTEAAEILLRRTAAMGGWVLTPDDAFFPDGLRNLSAVPLVLYGLGEMPNLARIPAVAMVGTRRCTPAGEESAGFLAEGVARGGAVVVSGGAVGIDAACHAGALEAGGVTVAVQACGLDVNYPAPNETLRKQILHSGGALLSEYPLGVRPSKDHFHPRNRLISGMSVATCVVEAPLRSGALITAHAARDQGKDVFAVPGSIFSYHSAGCNRLIRQGAVLVNNGADILQELESRFPGVLDVEAARTVVCRGAHKPAAVPSPSGDQPPAAESRPAAPQKEKFPLPAGASDTAKKLYDQLEPTPIGADDLAERLGLSVPTVLTGLTELELLGVAVSYPGKRYSTT